MVYLEAVCERAVFLNRLGYRIENLFEAETLNSGEKTRPNKINGCSDISRYPTKMYVCSVE